MHPLVSFLALLLLLPFSLSSSDDPYCEKLLQLEQVTPTFDNDNDLSSSKRTIELELIPLKLTYVMKLCVKTSGSDVYKVTYAVPDTGSAFTWLNSEECKGDACNCHIKEPNIGGTCIKEDPKKDFIPCKENVECKKNGVEKIKCKDSKCMYENSYFDKTTTKGSLAKGDFLFPSVSNSKTKHLTEKLEFGASTETNGKIEKDIKGLVGLGRGDISLLNQIQILDPSFSYCLPPLDSNTNSKIKFGSEVTTSDKFTPMLSGTKDSVCDLSYCVHLSGISVGEEKPVHDTNKVMVIDSGTTFTFLVGGLFENFFEKVKKAIGEKPTEIKFDYYDNCFEEESATKLQKLTFEFGELKVELPRENFFDVKNKGGKNYLCLTVKKGDEEKMHHHLLGSKAQMNFLVAFDLRENKVSFQKQHCSVEQHKGEFSALSPE